MKNRIPVSVVLATVCSLFGPASRAEHETLACSRAGAGFAPPDSREIRQYAPSREIDILHLALDVTPDFRRRTIAGEAALRFKPIAKPLPELQLDAVDLTVTNVTATEKILAWQVTTNKVIITFAEPIPADKEATVTLRYRAQPVRGLYFRTREMGYPPEDEHLWTQGESIESRHWFPGFDAPNEKFTSELTCHVPAGMVVLSNGRKVSEEQSGGLVAVRWLQDKPHVNYLISLVAGHLRKIEDRHRDIPLAFWTVPSDAKEAANSFADTRDMMEFFEKETGVPYPWAKYDQVCVLDFSHGGMENTSISTLNNHTLFTKETENIRSSQGLVAHELAHQWFGDLVTCKDWSHTWLNEGFATYYELLYDEHKQGRDHLLQRLWGSAQSIAGLTSDALPVVSRGFATPSEQFSVRAYGKGAWILHMLRSQLGPDLYRRCIRTYLERHAYGSVITEDLNAVIEELSGRSFDQFFDQWVYRPGVPVLDADYQWDERSKLARVTVRQAHSAGDKTLLFQFPLTVRFKSGSTVTDRQVIVKERSDDFYFPLAQAPALVRLDPELTVLAKVNFRPPAAMLDAQLSDPADVVGRLLAIEQLQTRADHESVGKLKAVLNKDSFHGVRSEAARALRAIHTDEALEALIASRRQTDARVRRQVVADIGGFYRDTAHAALQQVLQEEKNPDILAEAISGLAACAKPEVRALLLQQLRSHSYRNTLAEAAIRALRAQDDPSFLGPLLEILPQRETEFTSRTFAAGLDALAWLARTQTDKNAVREFLVRQTASLKQPVQIAALAALGTLEDPRALPVLATFASAAPDSPERRTAEKAVESIRARRAPSAELGELRKEVLGLQKENRELKKDVETLKKKFDAGPPARNQPQVIRSNPNAEKDEPRNTRNTRK